MELTSGGTLYACGGQMKKLWKARRCLDSKTGFEYLDKDIGGLAPGKWSDSQKFP